MFLSKTRAAALDLFMPIFVFGGMALGWYTPTEGAAVAVAYAIFIGGVVHRELNWKKLFPIIVESVVITGAVLLMVGLASSYSYIITLTHIPKMVATFVSELSAPSWILVLIVFGILIAVGMVMDGLTAFIIFLPVLLPLGNLLHMPNPIQLILFVAITIVLGVMTPPVGVCLFLASAIAKIDIFRIFRATFPFLVILMFVTILVGFIPFITTWLPSITVK
jgi:tripartite ATP-independent transporter DctM subunit